MGPAQGALECAGSAARAAHDLGRRALLERAASPSSHVLRRAMLWGWNACAMPLLPSAQSKRSTTSARAAAGPPVAVRVRGWEAGQATSGGQARALNPATWRSCCLALNESAAQGMGVKWGRSSSPNEGGKGSSHCIAEASATKNLIIIMTVRHFCLRFLDSCISCQTELRAACKRYLVPDKNQIRSPTSS
jgi:hypothetical protein